MHVLLMCLVIVQMVMLVLLVLQDQMVLLDHREKRAKKDKWDQSEMRG
uniref:Uncharacterized protein n=1 Tax=Romanomermis culicivorax TaxID=13658 RepID=A0A915J3I5_ROMCU